MKLSKLFQDIIPATPHISLQEKIWDSWIGKPLNQKVIHEIERETQNHYVELARKDNIWAAWSRAKVEVDRLTSVVSITPPAPIIPRAPSPAQSSYARVEEDRRRNEQNAKDKAEILLLQHLSDKQKDDLIKKGFFLVEVGGETYKIKRGFAGNIKLLDKDTGQESKSFCIHPKERVPDSDAMLAQKLMLEADTERFLKIANVTNLLPPRPPQNDNQRAA